jgi:hypothetical protein
MRTVIIITAAFNVCFLTLGIFRLIFLFRLRGNVLFIFHVFILRGAELSITAVELKEENGNHAENNE